VTKDEQRITNNHPKNKQTSKQKKKERTKLNPYAIAFIFKTS